MSDEATTATRENTESHEDELRTCLNGVLDQLNRLQVHARSPDKAKWARLQTKAHQLINSIDRVLQAT